MRGTRVIEPSLRKRQLTSETTALNATSPEHGITVWVYIVVLIQPFVAVPITE